MRRMEVVPTTLFFTRFLSFYFGPYYSIFAVQLKSEKLHKVQQNTRGEKSCTQNRTKNSAHLKCVKTCTQQKLQDWISNMFQQKVRKKYISHDRTKGGASKCSESEYMTKHGLNIG